MTGFFANIEDATKENSNFRKVIFTGTYCQLVVMSLLPGEDVGEEVHGNLDQFFRFEDGEGKVIMGDEEIRVGEDDVVIVPAGVKHNIINTSTDEPLKLYTIYSPPNHPAETVHATKADAQAAEEEEK